MNERVDLALVFAHPDAVGVLPGQGVSLFRLGPFRLSDLFLDDTGHAVERVFRGFWGYGHVAFAFEYVSHIWGAASGCNMQQSRAIVK